MMVVLQNTRGMSCKGLKKNLQSIGKLDYLGCNIHVESGILKLEEGNLLLMKVEKITSNLYMFLGDTLQEGNTTFLHIELEEEIYMFQLKGLKKEGKENLICRFTKSLYGLNQALICWYKRFDSFITSLDYNRLNSYHCMYYKRFDDNDYIILLLYVDDILVVCPNKDQVQELKAQLVREFDMKDMGPTNKILGMQIDRDKRDRKFWLSQMNVLNKVLWCFNKQNYKPIFTLFLSTLHYPQV